MNVAPHDLAPATRLEARALGFSLLKTAYHHDAPAPRDATVADERQLLADAEVSIKKAIADANQALVMASAEERTELSAKRDDLVGKLMQLKTGALSRSEAVGVARSAAETASQVSSLAGSIAVGGTFASIAATAELRAQELRGRDLMSRTFEHYERRTTETLRDAARYGVDVSEEQKRIDDAKRREKEALERGDVAGALDARIGGRDAHIAAIGKIIDNPSTPESARADLRKRKEEEIRLREQEVQQRLHIEDARLQATGVTAEQRIERLKALRESFDQQLDGLASAQEIKASRQRIGLATKAAAVVDSQALHDNASLDMSDTAAFEDRAQTTDQPQHTEAATKADAKPEHGLPASANKPTQPAPGRAQS